MDKEKLKELTQQVVDAVYRMGDEDMLKLLDEKVPILIQEMGGPENFAKTVEFPLYDSFDPVREYEIRLSIVNDWLQAASETDYEEKRTKYNRLAFSGSAILKAINKLP